MGGAGIQGAETEEGHGETLGPQHAWGERARLERLGWYVYEAARENVPRAPDPRPQTPGARAASPMVTARHVPAGAGVYSKAP